MCSINKCTSNNMLWWSEELIFKPSCIWFLYNCIFHEFLFSSNLLYLKMQVLPLRFNFWDLCFIHRFHGVILNPSEIWRFTVRNLTVFSTNARELWCPSCCWKWISWKYPKTDAVDLKTQHSINWLCTES